MKTVIAYEVVPGCSITFAEIFPKTVWVSSVKIENWANTIMVVLNKGEYKLIAHQKVKII